MLSEAALGKAKSWSKRHSKKTDALIVESTANAWDFYGQVEPLVGRAVVANPRLVKVIASAQVKTDKIDTLALAKLLAANLIPEVWCRLWSSAKHAGCWPTGDAWSRPAQRSPTGC